MLLGSKRREMYTLVQVFPIYVSNSKWPHASMVPLADTTRVNRAKEHAMVHQKIICSAMYSGFHSEGGFGDSPECSC
jgi:hypothetical protein